MWILFICVYKGGDYIIQYNLQSLKRAIGRFNMDKLLQRIIQYNKHAT